MTPALTQNRNRNSRLSRLAHLCGHLISILRRYSHAKITGSKTAEYSSNSVTFAISKSSVKAGSIYKRIDDRKVS